MKTRKLRLLSFVLAVAMMFAILPVSAFAATSATELTVSVSKAGENGKCALEQAVSELGKTPEELAQVTTLDLDTAEGIMLTIDDVTYLKKTFTAIQTLDLTDADFIDNQGDGKNNSNWKHPWKGNTVDVEHQFPDCAFSDYSGTLSTVIFGSKIKSIGAFAFSGCSSLTEVRFVNSSLEAIDNDGFRNTSISAIDIPDTVSYMGYGVFYGTKLTEVRLPNLLTELKYQAFGHCAELKKVDLNNIQKIGGIDHQAASQCAVFLKCTKLSEIRLPATLQELGGEFTAVFNGCDIVVDATSNPDIQVGPCAFESGIDADSQGKADNGAKLTCKAFIYVQKSTENVNASENIGVAITNGGTFAENTTFEERRLATPTKDGYRFEGWYTSENFAEGTQVANGATPEANQTYYAKWYEYNAKVDAKEKANDTTTNYVGSPVDIAVEVNAEEADVNSIHKADLIFDDINAVEKVEVNGKTLSKPYTNIDLDSLNNSNAEQDIATMAMVPVTTESVILRVTFNKPGEHRMKIVLKDNLNNVVCASEDTTVTVKGKPIDLTPIEKGYYQLTLTDCAATLDDGTEVKSGESAYVQADKTVTLKLTASMDNMKFNGFVLDPQQDSLKYIDDTTATFTMPSESVSVTVGLQPEESDDSMDAAAVVTGVVLGTGTAILAYHIGTEVYAEQVLGKGVAIPRTREEVALKAWELAGKPAVELNGEPLSEAAQAEKWAVESGLMQNVDGSFNGSKKMSKLKALRTLDAAKKLG